MVSKALIAASTRPLILAILKQGENYGYRIIQTVREVSGGEIDWSEPMLYPVLRRLERDGLVKSKWSIMENGRLRKYYRLTARGHEELEMEESQWLKVHAALFCVLDAARSAAKG